MISGDRCQRCPVDASRLETLCNVGPLLAETVFVCPASLPPQTIEYCSTRRVKVLHRQDRDIAVLRVDPREHGPGCDPADQQRDRQRYDGKRCASHEPVVEQTVQRSQFSVPSRVTPAILNGNVGQAPSPHYS